MDISSRIESCFSFPGKDRIIFVTEEDQLTPLSESVRDTLKVSLEDEIEGPMKPNGEINWGCPCMAGMVSGPCGYAFREAFSCFHYSTAEPKGSDCVEKFETMRECFMKYPTVYYKSKDEKDDEEQDVFADDEASQQDPASNIQKK